MFISNESKVQRTNIGVECRIVLLEFVIVFNLEGINEFFFKDKSPQQSSLDGKRHVGSGKKFLSPVKILLTTIFYQHFMCECNGIGYII